MNQQFLDPVAKRVDIKWQRRASDNIQIFGNVDISETRMMRSVFSMINPRYEVHENALFFPYQSNTHIPRSGFFEHWAYDKHLNPIEIADHYKPVLKGYKDNDALPVYPFRAPFKTVELKGHYYYMGMLNPHYGHFIQEAITRLWLALQNPSCIDETTKFLFHVFSDIKMGFKSELYKKGIAQYLVSFGITPDRIEFVFNTSRVERVIIPESVVNISDGNCYMAKEAKTVWDLANKQMSQGPVSNSLPNPPTKIYLTRRDVKNPIQGRVLVNEAEIEIELERLGFFVLAPERYSQYEMQYLLQNCETLVGAPGSGLQNSFFIPNHVNVMGITTRPIIDINPGLNHQIHTDLVCGNTTYAFVSDLVGEAGNNMRWRLDNKSFINAVENIL